MMWCSLCGCCFDCSMCSQRYRRRMLGQEASDVNAVRPFHNALHAVFTARKHRMRQSQAEAVAFAANSMQLAEAVVARGRKRLHDPTEDQSNEKFTEEQEDEEEIEAVQQAGRGRAVPKRRVGREKRQTVNNKGRFHNGLSEIMRNFMQQLRIDMEWRAAMDKIAEEREQYEQEWQQKMERLQQERLTVQRAWVVREEERRMREERRAEQRDELITAWLTRLINGN